MSDSHQKVLGIINARGGSKGIPRKNIKALKGKPLIGYSIEAGLKSECIDDLIVSTDDEEIAAVAKEMGASVPFIRPADLSGDNVRQIEVILHCINYLKDEQQKNYDYIALLQPTSPLRIAEDIDNAYDLLIEKQADSVISFTSVENHHPYHMYYIEDHKIKSVIDHDRSNLQRQTLQEAFIVNGAVRIVNTDVLIKSKSFFSDNSVSYIMPNERSINIDEPYDWQLAEFILSRR